MPGEPFSCAHPSSPFFSAYHHSLVSSDAENAVVRPGTKIMAGPNTKTRLMAGFLERRHYRKAQVILLMQAAPRDGRWDRLARSSAQRFDKSIQKRTLAMFFRVETA